VLIVLVDDILTAYPFPERSPVAVFDRITAGPGRDAVAVIDAATGDRLTYADLDARATAVAAALAALGARPGDRVVWSAPTGPDAIAVWMGIARTGCVDICTGDALKGALLEHVLDDSAARFAVLPTEAPAADTVRMAAGGLSSLDAAGLSRFDGVIRIPAAWPSPDHPAPERHQPRPDTAATVIYTSGTTGPSKGVLLCHHHQFFAGANLVAKFHLGAGSVLYHHSPFNHVTGRQLVIAAMLVGVPMVMRPGFSVREFWTDVNRHGITHSITLGSAVPLLMDRPGPGNGGSLRYVWASPAMPQRYAEFARRFGVSVVSPYGSTEVGIVVDPAVIPERPGPDGNSGRRSTYFDMAVLDDDDQPLPPGRVGELAIRPRLPWTTFLGYLNNPAATADRTANLWYHTGDLVVLDDDDHLFFVDRKQDFIRSKGENISSVELEQLLARHPQVGDCAVVPVASELADSDVLVALTPATGVTAFDPTAFYEWCAAEVPYFMVPRYVRVLDDLPRGPSGKVEKYKLRRAGAAEGTWDAHAEGYRATRSGIVRRSDVAAGG
jgi:crotonobetaine/carnitine-CoA ligase